MTDSIYEKSLITKHDIKLNHHKFPDVFHDKNGDAFRAKCDTTLFKNNETYYIEFKSSELNTITSLSSSYKRLLGQCVHRKLSLEHLNYLNHDTLSGLLWSTGKYRNDSLNYGWNHAKSKHKEISKVYRNNYIVVFDKHPPTIEYRNICLPFQQHYQKYYGVRTMLLTEFKEKFL